MAPLTNAALEIRLDWEPADGVTAPELASTWCRLELVVAGRRVTTVQDRRSASVRQGVYTSAYPLAEWIAEHWWLLRQHLRPSTVPRPSWTWRHVRAQPWLRAHNLRAAGGGMPWPDLTVVPEGSVTRIVWFASAQAQALAPGTLDYLTSGDVHVPSGAVTDSLSRFVDVVIGRLEERGVSGTPLQSEWGMLASIDDDEAAFASSSARLGVDPFDVDEGLAEDIVGLAEVYDPDLLAELLDSVRPESLRAASRWLEQARAAAVTVSRPSLPVPAEWLDAWHSSQGQSRWAKGYEAARLYRSEIGAEPDSRLSVEDLVATSTASRDAAGLQGLVVAPGDERVGLVLPGQEQLGPASKRFAEARALGASLLSDRELVLLDPTSSDFAGTVRAFAAELLAPAEGLRQYFSRSSGASAEAFESLGNHYGVSPLLVQHQYENQVVHVLP
jgi:hypothetical protein